MAPQELETYERYRGLATRFLSDTHDIWAVNQLAERWSKKTYKDEELSPPLVEADYNKSVEDVYRDPTISYIDRTTSLKILTAVKPVPIPSWVPRGDQYIGTSILGLYTSDHFASANRDAIVTPSPNPDRLTVRGNVVSRIVAYSILLDSSSFDLPLPCDEVHGPDWPLVHRFLDINPFAALWLSSGLARVHKAGHPYLQLLGEFVVSGYALVDLNNSLYEAYIKTWVNGKNMGEVN
jgi:hypothetical protein